VPKSLPGRKPLQSTEDLLAPTHGIVAEATPPQVAEPPKPEPIKFTVHGADPELVKQIRHLAVDTGRTIGDLSNEGWRYVLAQHGKGSE
jgi:hypothetical protein